MHDDLKHDRHHDRIAVIDFGGQYAHLIATKVRRSQVLAEIRQPEDPTEIFREYQGIILSGSPALSSFGEDSAYNKEIYELDIPILGFCFGHQEIAKHYGGTVVNGKQEWGHADLHLNREHPLFAGLAKTEQVWMSHFDSVTAVGPDFEELGFTVLGEDSPAHRFAAIGSDKLRRYGFQFHPEVDDTLNGDRMIANFVLNICGCRPTWTMDSYVAEQVGKIRSQVGDNSVFLLASGGVDSTVAARLFAEALGPDRLNLLHVDNGLMRKEASAGVVKMFGDLGLDRNFHFIDATDTFLEALEGLIEPEAKRRAIGDTFITVFETEAKRLGIEDRHHLSRHHRDRRHQARRHHQDPPQPGADHRGDDRRRQGGRTPGRPVQGRSSRAGRDAQHSPRHDLAASLPRARAGRAVALLRRAGRGRRGPG
jgi:GMP synthase (glutamine-hydrolysing)